MSKQQSQVTALLLPSEGGSDAPGITNLIKKYLFHWPLFLLGVTLCLVAGYFYLQIAKPVYPVTATLQFKTSTGASGGSSNNSLNQLDQVSNPVVVENEIEVMQSKKLIYQVVKDLQLWVNYSVKNGLATTDLYKQSPVTLFFTDTSINLNPKGEKLDILIKDEHSFILKDAKGDKSYSFTTPVKSTFGTWQLNTTDNLPLYLGQVITITLQDPDMVSDNYQSGIKIELENKDAPFVNLSMSDNVPARGKDILNSVIRIYRQNALTDKNEQTQKLLSFINARVDSLKQDLDLQEKNLEAFKRTQGITDIDAQAGEYQRMKTVNASAINDVNVQLSTLNTLEQYVSNTSNNQKLTPGSINVPDGSLIKLYDKLSELQLERAQKAAITPEANPLFVPIDRQITATKEDIKEKIQTIKTSLLANRQQLASFDASVSSSLSKVPGWEKKYKVLTRDLASKEDLYKLLSSKKEEIALQFATLIQDSEIVDDAHAGAAKWPKAPLVYALAFVVGIGAAAGLIYARESMNEQITSRKQVEEEAGVAILGELAHQDSKDTIVITGDRSRSAIGEQFRVLRTNLYHLLGGLDKGRVTLFTSSVSGEGKSFVSTNLAITLAYGNRKTIILEMDLRKPRVSGVFGLLPEHPGISNYLKGDSSNLKALIQSSGVPNLDVLGCGVILPNPSELLSTERLDTMINELKTMYDDIVIDSPPIHLVTDSLLIGRVADVCLYIVRQGYTHKGELEFIKEVKETNRFSKFTVVLNGVKRKEAYGYGYGGYSNEKFNSYAEKQKWNFGSSIKAFSRRF